MKSFLSKYTTGQIFKFSIIFSIFFHLLAVIFSEGFHRPDEHLGMLRYVFLKLGVYPESELSWEHPVMMRNWVQPSLYVLIGKILYFFEIKNPFNIVLVFRLVSSMIGLASHFVIAKLTFKIFEDDYKIKLSLIFLALLWFFPFIHARTTSEAFGTYSFVFALGMLFRSLNSEQINREHFRSTTKINLSQIHMILCGFFLGMTMNLRIPMGVMVLTFCLWSLFILKISLRNFIMIQFGVLSSILLTILVDSWGYGQWTYSTWNYLHVEFTRDISEGFGVAPWYEYIKEGILRGAPPVSLVMFISGIYFWIKRPFHVISLVSLSFFVLHTIIGHKELRYIFPIFTFLPWTMAYIFDQKSTWFPKKIVYLLFIVNFFALVISSTKPALSQIGFYKHLYSINQPMDKIYSLHWVKDKLKIYLRKDLPIIHLKTPEELDEVLSKNKNVWIAMEKIEDITMFNMKPNCERSYMAYPQFILPFIKKVSRKSKVWALYLCNKNS